MVISLLFDYRLAKRLEELGWGKELKEHMETAIIQVMDDTLFPGFKDHISGKFSASPLTISRRTGSHEGGITGWAFTNPIMPSVNKVMDVSKSVDTPLPDIFQAGQWVYSPSGMPIALLTGKLAADKANSYK